MNIEITKQEKNDVELKIDNQTIAEIMRVYLNNEGVEFAAWKKEHPTKPIVMKIQSNNAVKKIVSEAVAAVKKDLEKISSAFKKK